MRIVLYAPEAHRFQEAGIEKFIVETFFALSRQHPDHDFIMITDGAEPINNASPTNAEIVFIQSPSRQPLLKKVWANVRMKSLLKKVKADVLLLFERDGAITTTQPQCLLVTGSKKIKTANIKNVRSVVVMSNLVKEDLIKKYGANPETLFVLYSYPNKIFKPIDDEKRENLKKEYSNGLEYFLYNSSLERKEDLVRLLKSFSHFKKRQQSSFQLLLLAQSYPFLEETLSNYKYRSDVKFIYTKNKNDEAMITAAAYAVLLSFNTNDDISVALNVMQAGVPVITAEGSAVNEIIGHRYSGPEPIAELGDQMIRIYKNENYRSELIEKGKTIAAAFTPERSAELLWRSVVNAFV